MSKFLFFILLFSATPLFSQYSILGKWKTIDDVTGKEKSIVSIYEINGKIYGKVQEILEVVNKNSLCTKCSGTDKDKPILGMIVLKGLTKEVEEYSGKILDPKKGKIYDCSITFENKDQIKVHGYLGLKFIGRTQFWYRVK